MPVVVVHANGQRVLVGVLHTCAYCAYICACGNRRHVKALPVLPTQVQMNWDTIGPKGQGNWAEKDWQRRMGAESKRRERRGTRLTNRAAAHYGNLSALGGRHRSVDELLYCAGAPLVKVLVSFRLYLRISLEITMAAEAIEFVHT